MQHIEQLFVLKLLYYRQNIRLEERDAKTANDRFTDLREIAIRQFGDQMMVQLDTQIAKSSVTSLFNEWDQILQNQAPPTQPNDAEMSGCDEGGEGLRTDGNEKHRDVSQVIPAKRNDIEMTGRGKGGKGLGKGGIKRHRKILRDSVQGITKPAIRRLARRGGVQRISGMIYEEARSALQFFLQKVIFDAAAYSDLSKRKTITAMDVVYALKRQGRTLYGFEG